MLGKNNVLLHIFKLLFSSAVVNRWYTLAACIFFSGGKVPIVCGTSQVNSSQSVSGQIYGYRESA